MTESHRRRGARGLVPLAVLIAACGFAAAVSLIPGALLGEPATAETPHPLQLQSQAEVEAKDEGCVSCHAGIEPMHSTPGVRLACIDCHGGNTAVPAGAGTAPGSPEYKSAKIGAHVAPRFPRRWQGATRRSPSANPERTYTLLLEESPEFVRFVNPGDLRVADETCGPCHQSQVNAVNKSTMKTSSIFWAAAAYANGILPLKKGLFGESYGRDGQGEKIEPGVPPNEEQASRGALDLLLPLPRWEVVQPGEYFRAFERGGLLQPSIFPEIGNPDVFDEPGRPDIRLSNRGRGTGLRISPSIINLHKTRLNDPHLSFLGTNDHPGDFRSSGCSGCHVVYANDRDPANSGPWAKFGHLGRSATKDQTIPKDESGHPAVHRFTRAIPSSQCMSCHMHQPNGFVNTYLGYTMWDYVTDGESLWPETQRYPSAKEKRVSLEHNPEGAAVRGLWTDIDFLSRVSELNPELKHTQFADYHGHGWIFRAVFKRDRKGNFLDSEGAVVPFDDPQKFDKAVHLKDIHLERGMHCVDCHFSQDSHGDGLIHGEYGNAIEIQCQDCHGTVNRVTDLRTSGPASPPGGNDLSRGTTPFGQRRFSWQRRAAGSKLVQRSMLYESLEWDVVQVKDTVTVGHPRYNEKSTRAKTVQRDGSSWGHLPADLGALAHSDADVTCYACHSSWITSCSGCHLPQEANVKSEMLHYEGTETRNYASYNPQVIRTDMYMLGIDSTIKGNKVAPVRSSSALVLSSTNANRQRFYMQQPPISAPGFSSQAFNPHVPHTVRTVESKQCSDCHVSVDNDNNAWMAQVLTLGTNYVNFVGRYAWLGLGQKGVEAVAVTEWEEPQPVIGSYLHRLAFPDFFARHQRRRGELEVAHHHPGPGETRSVQLRGEFLHTAAGKGGYRVYDVANIDNKDFSERIVTAPVSPLGQRTYVKTRNAMAVALPTTMPVAPWRRTSEQYPQNQEQPMHPIYHYAFIADSYEGLILVNVDTLTDADPRNNFLRREPIFDQPSFNPDGLLDGASTMTIAGNYVYVGCDRGLVVVDFSDFDEHSSSPRPKIAAVLEEVTAATAIEVQFRYAFVTDGGGLAVIDVTDPRSPKMAARVKIADARNVYVARTYAYVAAGAEGLVIVDVEQPKAPRIDQTFNAGGVLSDVWDVKVASTAASSFAYVADGDGGLRVLQLTSPETTPGYLGFSPRPAPKLIATAHTKGPAVALSKGLDRDRAVDESGNQVSVFNRVGARPFTLEEMQRLYMKDGKLYQVEDEPAAAAARTSEAREARP